MTTPQTLGLPPRAVADDFSLDTVEYWKLNWTDYFAMLPQDFSIVQLALSSAEGLNTNGRYANVGFASRVWCRTKAIRHIIS